MITLWSEVIGYADAIRMISETIRLFNLIKIQTLIYMFFLPSNDQPAYNTKG